MAGANFPIGSVSGTRLDLSPWLESMQTELQRQLQNRSQDMQGQQFDRSMDMREADQQFGQKMSLENMDLAKRQMDNKIAMDVEMVDQADLDRKAKKESLDSELAYKKQAEDEQFARQKELEDIRANREHKLEKFRLENEWALRDKDEERKAKAEKAKADKADKAERDAAMADSRQMEFDRMRDEKSLEIAQKVQWADDGSLSLYIPQETSPELAAKGMRQPPIERKFQTVAEAAETMRQSFTKGLDGDKRLAVESAIDKWEQSALKRQADERARAKFELDQQAKREEMARKERELQIKENEAVARARKTAKGVEDLSYTQRDRGFTQDTTPGKNGAYGDKALNDLAVGLEDAKRRRQSTAPEALPAAEAAVSAWEDQVRLRFQKLREFWQIEEP